MVLLHHLPQELTIFTSETNSEYSEPRPVSLLRVIAQNV